MKKHKDWAEIKKWVYVKICTEGIGYKTKQVLRHVTDWEVSLLIFCLRN